MWLNSPSKNLKCFKLMPMWTSAFFISYKDGDDVYGLFKEKLNELDIPPETVYDLYYDGTHNEIVSAEQITARANKPDGMLLYVRDRNAYVNSFKDREDLAPKDTWRKERTTRERRRRSRSGPRNRGCSSKMECSCLCHVRYPGCYCGTPFYSYPNYWPMCGPAYSYMEPCFGCPGMRM